MPSRIEVQRLRELLAQGAQLVEVLPVEEFWEEHLAAAGEKALTRAVAGRW